MTIFTGNSKNAFPDTESRDSNNQTFLSDIREKLVNATKDLAGHYRNNFTEDGLREIAGSDQAGSTLANQFEPSQRKIYTQTPRGTVLVKKRVFSSLRDNFDPRFIDEDERLYLTAVKILFKRKAQEIAYYEHIAYKDDIFEDNGFLNIDNAFGQAINAFIGIIGAAGVSDLTSGTEFLSRLGISVDELAGDQPESFDANGFQRFISDLNRIRVLNQRSKANDYTTWIEDDIQRNDLTGPGTGTIELTLFTNFSTRVSIDGSSSANISAEDPYRLMMITASDVEIAVRSALNIFDDNGASFFRDSSQRRLEEAKVLDKELNTLRRTRNKSTINFKYNKVGDLVVVIADLGQEINVTNANVDEAIDGLFISQYINQSIPDSEKLLSDEIARVIRISSLLSAYRAEQIRDIYILNVNNERYSELRRRMRDDYLGHPIIQNMDEVHIFMNSNTRNNSPTYYSNISLDRDSLTSGITSNIDNMSESAVRAEYDALDIGGIPFPIYALMRRRDSLRGDGIQIFEGLVSKPSHSFNSSTMKFNLSFSIDSNLKFLKLAQYNKNPSLAQLDSILYEPLTAFDYKTQKSTGLIINPRELSEENKRRMRYLRFDDSEKSGLPVSDAKRLFSDKHNANGKDITTMQHVPGLVYKWKKGITTITLDVNMRRPLSGDGLAFQDAKEIYGLKAIDNIFAGMDAADVVSILITGAPYDYSSFLKSSASAGTFSNSETGSLYFNRFFDFFQRNDRAFGSFIPAKASLTDPKDAVIAFEAQRKLKDLYGSLNSKQREISKLNAVIYNSSDENTSTVDPNTQSNESELVSANKRQVQAARREVDDIIRRIDAVKKEELPTSVKVAINGNLIDTQIDERDNEEYSDRLKYQLLKKPEDVRYSNDNRYFVVDETYDTDTEIQAFVAQGLNSPGLFDNSFEDPLQVCQDVAKRIEFEFFADSQGNIVFRPPQYNKTPLTLMFKLINQSKATKSSLVPEFLVDLFQNRIETIENNLFEKELSIYEQFLLGGKSPLLGVSESSDRFKLALVPTLSSSENDDLFGNFFAFSKERIATQLDFAKVDLGENPPESNDIFGARAQSNFIIEPDVAWEREDLITELTRVRMDLGTLRGKVLRIEDVRVEAEKDLRENLSVENASSRRISLKNRISSLISERQILIRELNRAIKNSVDLETSEAFGRAGGSVADSLASWSANITDPVGQGEKFPKFLRGLIEDNVSNRLGYASGRRFIINDESILSSNFSYNEPSFVKASVTGQTQFVSGNGNFGNIPKIYAASVDYDLWRKFGFQGSTSENKPYFNNAETQCAPYSNFMLIRERKRLVTGTVTVVGNEFYQAGDVVYLNYMGLIFYVESVSHSHDQSNGSFTTSLSLTYGRALGEYIPTPLDIIGKGLIASRQNTKKLIRTNRNSVPSNQIMNLGTVALSLTGNSTDDLESTVAREAFLKKNKRIIDAALAKGISKSKQSEFATRIEIRTYKNGSADVLGSGSKIKKYMQDYIAETISPEDAKKLITYISIDITKEELSEEDRRLKRFPSNQAWQDAALASIDDGQGVSIPVNCADIFYVVDRDEKKETLKNTDKQASKIENAERR